MYLYSDGTLAPASTGFAGCGYLIEHNGVTFSGHKYLGRGTEVHSGTAEFAGLALGLKAALDLNPQHHELVHVKIDSEMVFQRLQAKFPARWSNQPYYQYLIESITILRRLNYEVHLIPRVYNKADRIAKLSLEPFLYTEEWEQLILMQKPLISNSGKRRLKYEGKRRKRYRGKIDGRD